MAGEIYVTTTIPYVNARPHLGFALELVQADAVARHHRLLGRRVRLQTGTDDNALSNVLSARAEGVPVEVLVERNAAAFRELGDALGISTSAFVRTSARRHHEAVQAFLSRLRPDDTYVAPYRGLYCPRCEDFYLEADAEGGCCPEHGTALDEVEETNHFFRLSRYQERLRSLIAEGRLEIVPESRRSEVLRFIESGLRDFSISRSATRAGGWGVPYPGDADQVVYVWVDALINYLSGLGFPREGVPGPFWRPESRKIHVIGKNVWKFHAVYWPALLLSTGLRLPDRIFVHGFLTEGGRKISKSAGNASDPLEIIDRYGTEAVRWFLLAHARPYTDTDFSEGRLAAAYQADLANTLGNLFSRLTSLCAKAGVEGVAARRPPAPPEYEEQLESFRFDGAAASVLRELGTINREISEVEPWTGLDPERIADTRVRLRGWATRLHAAAYWLDPFLPRSSARVVAALTASRIRAEEPLFPRGTIGGGDIGSGREKGRTRTVDFRRARPTSG
jgi:methionyl-tRNA synthetase